MATPFDPPGRGTVHLGSLGTPREAIDADFDYFGETIRVHPQASDLAFIDLMDKAARFQVDEDSDPDLVAARDLVLGAIQPQVHPDDWDLFWKTARANGQTTRDLMALSERLAEAASGFPTGRPSGSTAGRSSTKTKSSAGSRLRDAERALVLLKGRPDRQAMVMAAYGARSAG